MLFAFHRENLAGAKSWSQLLNLVHSYTCLPWSLWFLYPCSVYSIFSSLKPFVLFDLCQDCLPVPPLPPPHCILVIKREVSFKYLTIHLYFVVLSLLFVTVSFPENHEWSFQLNECNLLCLVDRYPTSNFCQHQAPYRLEQLLKQLNICACYFSEWGLVLQKSKHRFCK